MDDRELLELAAKAADIEVVFWSDKCAMKSAPHTPWRPLTDDGDALRLAVKLCMQVTFSEGVVAVSFLRVSEEPLALLETVALDMNVSARRAIVRAAAEIGEKMKEQHHD